MGREIESLRVTGWWPSKTRKNARRKKCLPLVRNFNQLLNQALPSSRSNLMAKDDKKIHFDLNENLQMFYEVTRGQCYNHRFRRFSPILDEKGRFLKNHTYDPLFAQISRVFT
jgi:hypothetical protein